MRLIWYRFTAWLRGRATRQEVFWQPLLNCIEAGEVPKSSGIAFASEDFMRALEKIEEAERQHIMSMPSILHDGMVSGSQGWKGGESNG